MSVRESPSTSCASVPRRSAVKPAASTAQIVAMVRSVMRGVCRGPASIQVHNVNLGHFPRMGAGSHRVSCGKIVIADRSCDQGRPATNHEQQHVGPRVFATASNVCLTPIERSSTIAIGILIVCLIIMFGFEATNGFHDNTKAVATVILPTRGTPPRRWCGRSWHASDYPGFTKIR